MLKKVTLVLILLSLLSSCRWFGEATTPFFSWTNFKVPPGTPVFQQGYKDGCSTVLYARGNVFYRSRYSYKFDPKMIGNTEYRFGHSRGYSFCFQHVLASTSGPVGSFDKYLSPQGYDKTYNAGNINDTWDGALANDGVFSGSVTTPGNGLNGIFDVLQKGGSGETRGVFDSNPLWAGGSKGQYFGWGYDGSYYGN